ncbi:MAG: GtrA family protein, partial [Chloroflexota bacterium]|nr:GtrA family protein [Chloroflexota bacterium]
KLLYINPVLASMCSFTAAIISNFVWNRYWTYPDSRSKSLARQLMEFAIVNLVGVGIRTPVFAILNRPLMQIFEKMTIPPLMNFLTPQFLGYNFALAIAVVLVMLWNFFVNRYWTYNDVD